MRTEQQLWLEAEVERLAPLEAIVRRLAAARVNGATPLVLCGVRDAAREWAEANPEATT
jgi:hypothetical protein